MKDITDKQALKLSIQVFEQILELIKDHKNKSIIDLKSIAINNIVPSPSGVLNNCFLCEYACQNTLDIDYNYCDNCPIGKDWITNKAKESKLLTPYAFWCEESGSPYSEIRDYNVGDDITKHVDNTTHYIKECIALFKKTLTKLESEVE